MVTTAIKIPSRSREAAIPLRPVVDPAVWTAEDLDADKSWIHPLTGEDIAELDVVIADFEARITTVMDIKRGDYELPRLGPKLQAIADDILEGRGLALIRGVPVARYSRTQAAIAFWCIGHYVGDPVSQNSKGHLLGHVADLGGTTLANPKNRGYQTHEQLPFHCDSCDVVGLLCLQPAKSEIGRASCRERV